MFVVAGFLALSLAGGFMAQTFQGLSDAAIRGGVAVGLPDTSEAVTGQRQFS